MNKKLIYKHYQNSTHSMEHNHILILNKVYRKKRCEHIAGNGSEWCNYSAFIVYNLYFLYYKYPKHI